MLVICTTISSISLGRSWFCFAASSISTQRISKRSAGDLAADQAPPGHRRRIKGVWLVREDRTFQPSKCGEQRQPCEDGRQLGRSAESRAFSARGDDANASQLGGEVSRNEGGSGSPEMSNSEVPSVSEEGTADNLFKEIPMASEESQPQSTDTVRELGSAVSEASGSLEEIPTDSKERGPTDTEGESGSAVLDASSLLMETPTVSQDYESQHEDTEGGLGSAIGDASSPVDEDKDIAMNPAHAIPFAGDTELGPTSAHEEGGPNLPESAGESSADANPKGELRPAVSGADQSLEEDDTQPEVVGHTNANGEAGPDSAPQESGPADSEQTEVQHTDTHCQEREPGLPKSDSEPIGSAVQRSLAPDPEVTTVAHVEEDQDSHAPLPSSGTAPNEEGETDQGDHIGQMQDVPALAVEEPQLASVSDESQGPEVVLGQDEDAEGPVASGRFANKGEGDEVPAFSTLVGVPSNKEDSDREQDGNATSLSLAENVLPLLKSDDDLETGSPKGYRDEVFSSVDPVFPQPVFEDPEVLASHPVLNEADLLNSSEATEKALGASAEVTFTPVIEEHQAHFTGAPEIAVDSSSESPTENPETSEELSCEERTTATADSPVEESQRNVVAEDPALTFEASTTLDHVAEVQSMFDTIAELQKESDSAAGDQIPPDTSAQASAGDIDFDIKTDVQEDIQTDDSYMAMAEDLTTVTNAHGFGQGEGGDSVAENTQLEQGTFRAPTVAAKESRPEERARQLSPGEEVPVGDNWPADAAAVTNVQPNGDTGDATGEDLSSVEVLPSSLTISQGEPKDVMPVGDEDLTDSQEGVQNLNQGDGGDSLLETTGPREEGISTDLEEADAAQRWEMADPEVPPAEPAAGDEVVSTLAGEPEVGEVTESSQEGYLAERTAELSPSGNSSDPAEATTKYDTDPPSSGEPSEGFEAVEETGPEAAESVEKEQSVETELEGRPPSQAVPTNVDINYGDKEFVPHDLTSVPWAPSILATSHHLPEDIIDVEKELGDLDELDSEQVNKFEDYEVTVVESIPALVAKAATERSSVVEDLAATEEVTVPASTAGTGVNLKTKSVERLSGNQVYGSSSRTAAWFNSLIQWFAQFCSSTQQG